jgi:uncharacterized protein YheU (UPF0270 family)
MSEHDVIEVPYQALQSDTLRAVVEEFITRAGTDYGERERTLDSKIADVMRQLRRGEAVIVYDPRTQTASIVVPRARSRETPATLNATRRPTPAR